MESTRMGYTVNWEEHEGRKGTFSLNLSLPVPSLLELNAPSSFNLFSKQRPLPIFQSFFLCWIPPKFFFSHTVLRPNTGRGGWERSGKRITEPAVRAVWGLDSQF